jgi:hypothetical protein
MGSEGSREAKSVLSTPIIHPDRTGYSELVRWNADFRLLWFGQIVSLMGDWFTLIASAILISILTQSGVAGGKTGGLGLHS